MTPEQKATLLAAQTDVQVDDAFDIVYDLVYDPGNGTLDGMKDQVDRLLVWAQEPDVLSRLHLGLILACVRLPYMVRHHLTTWRPFRDAVEAEFTRRGEDADALLIGLMEDA